jgi:hypothetical protein
MLDKLGFVVIGLIVGAAVAVIVVLCKVVKAVVSLVKEVYKVVVPIQIAADAFRTKLTLEKEKVPYHTDFHHDELETLYELINHLFYDWSALVKQAEVLNDKVLKEGTTLLACPCAEDVVHKVAAMGNFITFALSQGETFNDSFRELAHRSLAAITEVCQELDKLSSARAVVLQKRRLEMHLYDMVVDTNREIHQLQIKMEFFLENVKPLMKRLSSRSVRDEVFERLAVAHPGTDPRHVELLLTARK